MSRDYKERADRILAELIDELVYEERQRILMEEKFALRVQELETLANDLAQCVRHMCGYTITLEQHILPVSGTGGFLGEIGERVHGQRAQMVRDIAAVSGTVGADAERVMQPASPLLMQPATAPAVAGEHEPGGSIGEASNEGESCSGDARASLESARAANLAQTEKLSRALLAHKEALLTPLTDIRHLLATCVRRAQSLASNPLPVSRADEAASGTQDRRSHSPPRTELLALHQQVATLCELLHDQQRDAVLANRGPNALTTTTAGQPSQRALATSDDDHRIAEREEKQQRNDAARARAYEMTVDSLNREVLSLQEQNARACATHADEVNRLRVQHAASVEEYQSRLAECDTALCRVSLELEQLIKENAQLKKQLRAWQAA